MKIHVQIDGFIAVTKLPKRSKTAKKATTTDEPKAEARTAVAVEMNRRALQGLVRGYELRAIEHHMNGFAEMHVDVRLTDQARSLMEGIATTKIGSPGGLFSQPVKALRKAGRKFNVPKDAEVDETLLSGMLRGYLIHANEMKAGRRITDQALKIMIREASFRKVSPDDLPKHRA